MDFKKPILVTGASGKTGRRVVAALAKKGGVVRAFVRRPEAEAELRQAGAADVAMGDLTNTDSLKRALEGAEQVLHICPPMHPQEDTIAATMIDLCAGMGTGRFVLYSVLHPLLSDVPHHDRKLCAERHLVDSGVTYTILQPGRYMQHLVPIWKSVLATGVHNMPFSTTARFSVVDLADLADVCARVMLEPGHEHATYQLAGPDALSQDDMARILSGLVGKPIRAEAKPPQQMRAEAEAAKVPAERIQTMLAMNAHYDGHGLMGNSNVLRWLLGRSPNDFATFVRRELL
ncbi:SDR family oxidoreductase [Rhodoplanes sp. Z2-YC6860]|uniref:SDR family oxidoreductase n=1 Tax=Rhodoplanes sp. Z2-YC6860 TaxID=674703 RepID=UPI00078BE825|nr:NAD(P)H-binding protein [Rhodoplanes sp. Z2-YC6860]AMN44002.1 nucleoside-diphosphate-sugar epimerase [Rhodoplanes sp. Z2-YC6860]